MKLSKWRTMTKKSLWVFAIFIFSNTVIKSIHHALVRVFGLICSIQEVAVLQLLTQPLQSVEWLIELHGHGHLGQVLANVVFQDVPQAHTAGGTGWRQRGASRSHGHHTANWRANTKRRRWWDGPCLRPETAYFPDINSVVMLPIS